MKITHSTRSASWQLALRSCEIYLRSLLGQKNETHDEYGVN